jgi:DNA-binding beta-propeller fold protein YncE
MGAMGLAGAMCLALAASCAGPTYNVAPTLEPAGSTILWPSPPETPRFAYAGTLIGEQNFIGEEADEGITVVNVLKWIAGLAIGERRYTELQRPVSGTVDSRGRVLVVDASRRSVFVFNIPEVQFTEWRFAAPKITFGLPVAIEKDGQGGFLVTDSERAEVFRLDATGQPIGRFGKGVLSRPTGIARDPETGRIYVADTAAHDLKIFNAEGVLVDTLGARGRAAGRFNAPTHLAFHGDRLFVADTLNFRIQVFDRGGDGRLAFGEIGLFVGNMTRPKGVAVGRDGRIYVVESYYDHLLVYNEKGDLLLPIGGTGTGIGRFYLPSGVWTDDKGRVFVADMFNGRVAVFKELTTGQLAGDP